MRMSSDVSFINVKMQARFVERVGRVLCTIITSILNSPEVRFLMAASRPIGITLTPPTRSFPLICKVRGLLSLLLCWLVEGGVGDQGPVWSRSQSEERHHSVITHNSNTRSNNLITTTDLIIIFPASCDTKYTNELELNTRVLVSKNNSNWKKLGKNFTKVV